MTAKPVLKIKVFIVLIAAIIVLPIYSIRAVHAQRIGTAYSARVLESGDSGRFRFHAGSECRICVESKSRGNHANVDFESPNKEWSLTTGECINFRNSGGTDWTLKYMNTGRNSASVSFECG